MHSQVNAEFVARMEDVLDLYGEAPDQKRPVICFDESPTQLIGEVRQPIPAAPGQLERTDFEYRRNGTVNLFIFLDAHRPWRKVKVADRRTAEDFAPCMRELADVHFPEAERIRVVLDNARQSVDPLARRPPRNLAACRGATDVLRRLEFHYTPKHASWLNMVEIEIGVLRGQCLDRAASTTASGSSPRSQPGNTNATKAALASTGCSQPKKPEPKWPVPIPKQHSKSHNHCAKELV